MIRFFSAAILSLFLIAPFAGAQTKPPEKRALSALDRADIARAENYLNGFRSLKARFMQFAPDGSLAEGTLYLRRPGNMRFEYDDPSPILIVANGVFLIFHDKSIDQINRVPINSTPLGLLLDEKVALEDSRIRIRSIERGPGVLRISVYDSERPKEGYLTLLFADSPLALRGWEVTDAGGLTTSIAINRTETGLYFPDKLFSFIDPPSNRGPKR